MFVYQKALEAAMNYINNSFDGPIKLVFFYSYAVFYSIAISLFHLAESLLKFLHSYIHAKVSAHVLVVTKKVGKLLHSDLEALIAQ